MGGERGVEGASGLRAEPFLSAPSLPKGGGAIRGIGEKLSVNPARGTGSVQVQVYTSPGREGMSVALGLGYDSGAGNSPFGLGWRLDVPAIARRTEKGLPRYGADDAFVLTAAEDLVPAMRLDGPQWIPDGYPETIAGEPHRVTRFRPRIEGAFTRIERCTDVATGDTFWRTVSRDNVTSVYGRSPEARVADPSDPSRVFQWLLEETSDDRGNLVRYEYKPEDTAGVDPASVAERNRLAGLAPVCNRYLKRIRYGNRTPGTGDGWHFVIVFDYGDHDPLAPTPAEDRPWPVRPDPFSSYRAGFEIRTWRLCRRVLMFHDFPDRELGAGPLPRLVRSTDLVHDADRAAVRLLGVAQTGYVWDGDSYLTDGLPPVEFDYTDAGVDDQVRVVDDDGMANLPVGVDGQLYRWVDLDGDGLFGALTEQGGAWWYKPNLGGGRLGAVERLPDQPSAAGDGAATQLVDLAGDGRRALVRHGPVLHGYQERRSDGGWTPFVPFGSMPAVDLADPAVQQGDLDGDGRTDLVIAEGEVVRWHRSLGRGGWGPEQRVTHPSDVERGPALPDADPSTAVLLADMSGDGLADRVLVRNGEVCYYPNLGHGRFGAKVQMAGAPVFDHQEQFEPSRLRLADVDGSGPADLVYLGRGVVRYWLNESGNGFGPAQQVAAFPDVDRLDTVEVADVLGTGTSCLVWSSPLPGDSAAALRYVDLCRGVDPSLPPDDPSLAGHKPRLLRTVRNNLGGETRIRYAPSTTFLLADRAAGRDWATRLPFPVHVVERVENYDHVAKTRLVSTYRYRHGYYDGPEREFRGFGFAEQTDAESVSGDRGAGLFSEPDTTELHRPPVRTRTWFHTGAFLDEQIVSTQFRDEYWAGDPLAGVLPDSELPTGLTDREAREARRALAGQPLRTEVYADDGSAVADRPFTVTEHRYRVLAVQPSRDDRHGVFRSHPLETVEYHYERNPADPRTGHQLIVEVDEYGTVLQSASVGYPRRAPAEPEQARPAVVWTVNQVTNMDSVGQPYRLGVPIETRTYEVTGLPEPAGGRYSHAVLAGALREIEEKVGAGETGWEIPYEVAPAGAHAQRRLVQHVRTRYWDDVLAAALPWGEPGSRALVYETYKLGFTAGLLTQVYGDRVSDTMLTDEGRYLLDDGVWWIPSGVRHYDQAGFYLPVGLVDPFGNESTVDYDPYRLFVVVSCASHAAPYDVLISRTTHDYRLLAPKQTTDPNGNRSLVALDALGRVAASWVLGKMGSTDGDPDDLPGAVFSYDPWSWRNGQGPAWAQVETRERHGDPNSPWQRSRAWTDGSGRVAMTKTQAEPGLAWTVDANGQPVQVDTTPGVRWAGTGRVVFDNKGKPVKQYEPYFAVACVYEDEAALVEQGVTPVLHYDPLGRLVRTEHPDGTLSRAGFDPWRQETWDGNDTVPESHWYADRGSPDPAGPEPAGDPERRAAWLAAQHAGTPAVAHLDTLGRVFLTVADGGPLGEVATRTELDIEGNTRSVTDARGVVVLRQDNDVAGRVPHTISPDAGQRWTLPDVAGQPIRSWDSRGHAFRHTYDPLRRPVGLWMAASDAELLTALTVYGETHAEALDRNLLGRVHLSFDGAGLAVAERHDFKGNLVAGRRRLAADYHSTVDWSSLANLPLSDVEAAASLDAESFPTTSEYDALNRPVSSTLPDATVLLPRYNEAGLLDTVHGRLRGASQETPFVTELDYDAKGRRELIEYGNGARTVYQYDPYTYRLSLLRTLRGSERLQDLRYTYDPTGNIVQVVDAAQQTAFFDGQFAPPELRYVYDALARLTSATGREHASLAGQPDHREPTLAPLPHPNDSQAVRPYTQTYTYDEAGNVTTMAHTTGSGGWTRDQAYADDSNRLLSHTIPDSPFTATFGHDEHGNMTTMPHLPSLVWDHADRLQSVDLQGGGTAYYTYDGSGQRVRKVIERLGGVIEERLYLGGYELHRRRNGNGVTFERQTVHIMDDTRRIALVETVTVSSTEPLATRIRYQLGNHLGSCALELDDTAAVISYEEYHPYGTTSLWLARSGIEVSDRRYRYTGKEKDEETGLYYHGARYYAPWLARWTACDPVHSLNRYEYVKGNPVRLFDPDGAQDKDANAAPPAPYADTAEGRAAYTARLAEQANGVTPSAAEVSGAIRKLAGAAPYDAAHLEADASWMFRGTPSGYGQPGVPITPPATSRAELAVSGIIDLGLGSLAIAGGSAGIVAGTAASATGAGASVGVPTTLVGAGGVASGLVMAGAGVGKVAGAFAGEMPPESGHDLDEAVGFAANLAAPTGLVFATTSGLAGGDGASMQRAASTGAKLEMLLGMPVGLGPSMLKASGSPKSMTKSELIRRYNIEKDLVDPERLIDFSDYRYTLGEWDVNIGYLRGSRTADFAAANLAAGYSATPEGYVWHHHEDWARLQLVDKCVHNPALCADLAHYGGVHIYQNVTGVKYGK